MNKFGLTSYTNAIFGLGKEVNKLDLFIELSNNLLVVIEKEPSFIKFLADNNLELKEKRATLEKAFNQKEADLFVKWLLILITDHVVSELKYILKEVIILYNKDQGIIEGVIWTTTSLESAQIKKFNTLVSKKLNLKTNLVNKIDQELLGGIKIEVGDKIWDNTISRKLQDLTHELLMKG